MPQLPRGGGETEEAVLSAITNALDNLARWYGEQQAEINRLQAMRATIMVNAMHMGYSHDEAQAMADGTHKLTIIEALTKSVDARKRLYQAEAEAKTIERACKLMREDGPEIRQADGSTIIGDWNVAECADRIEKMPRHYRVAP
jgi:ribosomal 50S subunit-associated protein YjgA (DUF615 family)